jgi:hypothetical protein
MQFFTTDSTKGRVRYNQISCTIGWEIMLRSALQWHEPNSENAGLGTAFASPVNASGIKTDYFWRCL